MDSSEKNITENTISTNMTMEYITTADANTRYLLFTQFLSARMHKISKELLNMSFVILRLTKVSCVTIL